MQQHKLRHTLPEALGTIRCSASIRTNHKVISGAVDGSAIDRAGSNTRMDVRMMPSATPVR